MPSSGMSVGGGIPYPPIITTTSLPHGTQNQAYSAQLSAINGFPPYTWAVAAAPPGLTVDSSGVIHWTPTAGGSFLLTVSIVDSRGGSSQPVTLGITVQLALMITTTSPLPGATAGTAYSTTFAATGGTTPYSWVFLSGQPAWATLTAATGVLSGTPTQAESDSFTVQVQDSTTPTKLTASASFSLTVQSGAVVITTTSLPSATVGVAYSATLHATGGTTPYTWSITGGQDAQGFPTLVSASAGTLDGTPTQAESLSTFAVKVTDSASHTATATFPVTVVAAGTVVAPAAIFRGTIDSTHIQTGFTPPYATFTGVISAGTLTVTNFATNYPGTVLQVGSPIAGQLTQLASSTVISALGTGTGGNGTYTVTPNQNSGSQSMTGLMLADSYNLYRAPGNVAQPTVTPPPAPWVSVNQTLATPAGPLTFPYLVTPNTTFNCQPFVRDGSTATEYQQNFTLPALTSGSQYSYCYTAVKGGAESPASPVFTSYTLSGSTNSPTAPVQAADPANYVPAYAIPGGTRWTCTQTVSTSATGLTGTGTLGQTGCDPIWAFLHAAPGDVIVLTGGATYTSSINAQAWQPPAGGVGGYIYVISSQADSSLPGYNGGNQTLPPLLPNPAWAFNSQLKPTFAAYTLTGTVSAGSTLPNLSANWALKSGLYPTIFVDATTKARYQRRVLYHNGSAAITLWACDDGPVEPNIPSTCNATAWVAYLPGVTPYDRPAMATLKFSSGGGQPGGSFNNSGNGIQWASGVIPQKFRFVGINLQPTSATHQPNGSAPANSNSIGLNIPNGATNIMLDRCMVGDDTLKLAAGSSSTFGWLHHGIWCNASNFTMQQCYGWGHGDCSSPSGRGGTDAQMIFSTGGGPYCLQMNYIEAQAEGMIWGGLGIPQGNNPTDLVSRYNFNTKLALWAAFPGDTVPPWQCLFYGTFTKNHEEVKCVTRKASYGNVFMNNWYAYATAGQGGSLGYNALDQHNGIPTFNNPWVACTDTDTTFCEIWNTARGIGGYSPGNGLDLLVYCERNRMAYNMILINPPQSYTALFTGFLDDGSGYNAGNPAASTPSGIPGIVLTVTAIAGGGIWCSQASGPIIAGAVFSTVVPNSTNGTPCNVGVQTAGTANSLGQYGINQPVMSYTGAINNGAPGNAGNTLTVSGFTGVPLAVGSQISGNGATAASITAILSGTGTNGTYTISGAPQNIVAGPMTGVRYFNIGSSALTLDWTQASPQVIETENRNPDGIMDRNTVVMSTSSAGLYGASGVAGVHFANTYGGQSGPPGDVADRWQFTNNIFGTGVTLQSDVAGSAASTLNSYFPNSVWSSNLPVLDTGAQPTSTLSAPGQTIAHPAGGMSAVGFVALDLDTNSQPLQPLPSSNWNLLSNSAYVSSSTSGGPVGANLIPTGNSVGSWVSTRWADSTTAKTTLTAPQTTPSSGLLGSANDTIGNVKLLHVYQAAGNPVPTVADSGGNAWTLIGSVTTSDNAWTLHNFISYIINTSSSVTVTVTNTAACMYGVCENQYSGFAASSALAGFAMNGTNPAANQNDPNSVLSGPIVTTATSGMLYGFGVNAPQKHSPPIVGTAPIAFTKRTWVWHELNPAQGGDATIAEAPLPATGAGTYQVTFGTTYENHAQPFLTFGCVLSPISVPFVDANFFLANSFQGISTSIYSSDSNDTFFRFTGTDTKYGDVLPRSSQSVYLFGGTGGDDFVQETCITKLGNGYSADIVESIATDNTVPTSVSSTVRVSTLTNAYNGTVHTQNSYLVNPGSGTPSMVYMSRWIWLQSDLNTSTRLGGTNHFGEFVEFKTGPGNTDVERFQIGYQMTPDPNNNWTHLGSTPAFIMLHDQSGSAVPNQEIVYLQAVMWNTNTQASWGMGQTYAAPIPLGSWFKLEWAFNRNDSGGDGWMWAALTDPNNSDPVLRAGVQFFALRGAFTWAPSGTTLGMNMALPSNAIDKIFVDNTAYTDIIRSSSSTFVVKSTDLLVYNRWPLQAIPHPAWY